MRITSETRGERQPRCHLAQSGHNHIYEDADGSVGDEKRAWAGIHECLSPVTFGQLLVSWQAGCGVLPAAWHSHLIMAWCTLIMTGWLDGRDGVWLAMAGGSPTFR